MKEKVRDLTNSATSAPSDKISQVTKPGQIFKIFLYIPLGQQRRERCDLYPKALHSIYMELRLAMGKHWLTIC